MAIARLGHFGRLSPPVVLAGIAMLGAFGLALAASSTAHALTWLLFKNPRRLKKI